MVTNSTNSKLTKLLTLSLTLLAFPILSNADCAIGSTSIACVDLTSNLTDPNIAALFDLQLSGFLVFSGLGGIALGVLVGRH